MTTKQRLRILLAGCLVVGGYLTIGYLHLTNPDMTETRLFLSFWPIILGVIVALVVGFALLAFLEAHDERG